MPYRSPVDDFRFILANIAGFDAVAQTERFAEATPEVVEAVLTEIGRIADQEIAPLNRQGDLHPARMENGVVITSPGFGSGFAALAEGGWLGLAADPAHGGMGLPLTVATCVNDTLAGACLALQLNPLMSQGQIEALEHHASDELKAIYIPRLISGEWAGTMNLTEPEAGSDVGALRSKAEPAGDGTYRITGQKIFISWADNDFTANVCHLVLARLPDGAAGTKGISLFMVPKLIPDADGNPGARNALRLVSLEHKLGLHGSPTAVMSYEGAVGWLVGEPHGGMKAMFTMMNNARLGVGTQGIGVAEAACQRALEYAIGRKQGRVGGTGMIVEHADVRRMLATMRAETFGARAIALACAVAIDMGNATGDARWKARAALLTPLAKLWGTETGIRVAELGVQVHGGMGFIEETGAAQLSRDVRVTAIYEGTNGIQAMDLVGRKMMDGGAAIAELTDEIAAAAEAARGRFPDLADAVRRAVASLGETTVWLLAQGDVNERNAGAVAYAHGFSRVLAAHYHLAAAMTGDAARQRLARFYITRLLPLHQGHFAEARAGLDSVMSIGIEDLGA